MELANNGLNVLPIKEAAEIKHINDKERGSRLYFFGKLVETIFVCPITTTVALTGRVVKLITWDLAKAAIYKVSGYHTESADFLEREYLKTVRALRDFLFVPAIAKRAFQDMIATREQFVDDLPATNFIKVDCTKSFQQFSSYMHGCATFQVHQPKEITEFPATTDPTLKTVMASHIFQPGMMAINFGSPNVATFITEKMGDDSVQTIKVDAKSLKREAMKYHPTNGKIQSGVFLVPTNLPQEALNRYKQAAEKLQGRADITCVNTNCRVLEEAGFSIEGVAMDGVVFPGTLMEHLLFRNVFYKTADGVKHKVHFDILNTTKQPLEEFFEGVDMAVVGTRLRHRRRHADTEESQKARGAAAQKLIAEEKERLAAAGPVGQKNEELLGRRKVTISVPSYLGDWVARFWGRHTVYELDLCDKQEEISEAFKKLAGSQGENKPVKLRSYPQVNPSFVTRLKRDIFFSGLVLRFLRRHMMGQSDVIHLHTQDIFRHLESTKGAHLNYVLLDGKLVMARVHANGSSVDAHKKAADWVLSKHALLAGREEAYCSGEIWYDENKKRFMMNDDSGTYEPNFERVKLVVELANKFFNTQNSHITFEAVNAHEKAAEPATK